MTRDQALAQARKRWGKRARIERSDNLSSPEKREAAAHERAELTAKREAIEAEIKRREIEAGIPALREEWRALNKARERASWESTRQAFRVGQIDTVIGAFFVLGTGDTWEQAFAAADSKTDRVRA